MAHHSRNRLGRKQAFVLTFVAVSVLALAGAASAQEVAAFEELLPANTLSSLTLKTPSAQPAYKASAFSQIRQDPALRPVCGLRQSARHRQQA